MFSQLRTAVSTTVLSLAAIVMAPSASAAIVSGSWDPALPSPPFNNLGWTTTINLKVSDTCSSGAVSLPFIVNVFGRSFGCQTNPLASTSAFSILSAEIGIYDLTSRLLVDVLRFNASSFTPFLLDLGSGGAITFLLSLTDSNEVNGGIPSDNGYKFKLALPGPAPAIKYAAIGTNNFITGTNPPTMTEFSVNPNSAQASVLSNTRLEIGQSVAVPAPGSLALAALALAAAGLAAARRRAVA